MGQAVPPSLNCRPIRRAVRLAPPKPLTSEWSRQARLLACLPACLPACSLARFLALLTLPSSYASRLVVPPVASTPNRAALPWPCTGPDSPSPSSCLCYTPSSSHRTISTFSLTSSTPDSTLNPSHLRHLQADRILHHAITAIIRLGQSVAVVLHLLTLTFDFELYTKMLNTV